MKSNVIGGGNAIGGIYAVGEGASSLINATQPAQTQSQGQVPDQTVVPDEPMIEMAAIDKEAEEGADVDDERGDEEDNSSSQGQILSFV